MSCTYKPLFDYILGISLCIGGVMSYLPQYYSLIKSKQPKGISELSIFILNIGAACLTSNSFILNWDLFKCYEECSFQLCTGNLLSLIQIAVGWLSVFPLYLIYIRFKIRESEQRFTHDAQYIFVYIIFVLIMVIVGLTEEVSYRDSKIFFHVSAMVLGLLSAVCSCVVWLPQIVKLLVDQDAGSLSLAMFILQTPGNAVIILLQILYKQNWTTWITYVVLLVEQATIVIIMLVLRRRQRLRGQLLRVVIPDNEHTYIDPSLDQMYEDGLYDESYNDFFDYSNGDHVTTIGD